MQARLSSEKWGTRADLIICLEKAREYIDKTDPSEITLEGISNAVGISKHHLARIFKETYGRSPVSFATKIHLEKSKISLENSSEMVSMVALNAGFSSGTTFGRAFKREFGMTPLEYREQFSNLG
jgi:AraC-like DNA-binding protein